jgi:hypothetical protein
MSIKTTRLALMTLSDMDSKNSTSTEWEQITNAANAAVYTANNPYLCAEEKLEVAMWFTMPSHFTTYCLFGTATYAAANSLSWLALFGIPLITNIFFGLVNWLWYSKSLTKVLYMTLFSRLMLLVARTACFVYLASKGNYVLAIVVVSLSLGLQPLFEPNIWIIDNYFGRKYDMNPQYAFFKRFYGHSFPFEKTK